jgi:hypothetical protein
MKHQLLLVVAVVPKVSFSLASANPFDVEDAKAGLRGVLGNENPTSSEDQGWADTISQLLSGLGNNNGSNLRAGETPSDDTRIIGGTQAGQNEYPFAVSLQDHIGHFCGGSLIARDVVLSAAHCQGGPYDCVMGRHNLQGSQGQEIAMSRELPHPNYNDRTTDNDFMLIFLKSPATLNNDVKLVKPNKSIYCR